MIAYEAFFGGLLNCWKDSCRRQAAESYFSDRLGKDGSTHENGTILRSYREEIEVFIEGCFRNLPRKKCDNEPHAVPPALEAWGEEKAVTILMADLRDFTRLADKLRPKEVRKLLNQYISLMIEVIEKYRSTIVDFYGGRDSGFLRWTQNGYFCQGSRCSQVRDGNAKPTGPREWEKADHPAMFMGVGIHTGVVSVGFIGSAVRKKFGIVGSAVNETSRIQGWAQEGQVRSLGVT